jgi:hypothetical protein
VDLQEWPDREEDTRQIASSLGWAKCAVQSNSQNPGAQAFLALHARYLAVVKERDDLQRTNDTLAEIIGGEETAETKNYEIVDVAELQAQLAASEAARGRMREALELFEEYVKLSDKAWAEDGKVAAMQDAPTRRYLDHVRDLFKRADEVKAKIREALASPAAAPLTEAEAWARLQSDEPGEEGER